MVELERYIRQISIPEFGIEAQRKLTNSKVVILGLGGLGSAVATYLVAAGVGYIKLVDRDKVERNNLNRQILYTEKHIGMWKAKVAEERLKEINSEIEVDGVIEEIKENNIQNLIEGMDLVVDCLDNFETRFIVNRAVVEKNIPMVHGACRSFFGQVMLIVPGKTPCLRCIFPENIPKDRSIIGVTAGAIGIIQAAEVIKYITGIGENLLGKILIYDLKRHSIEKIEVERNPKCEVCG